MIDGAGRGNLWSTSGGDVYITFSNVSATWKGLQTVRIYLEKLTQPNRFISCVDEFPAPAISSQGHQELHDPEMVIDDATSTIAIVYARWSEASGNRVVLASGGLSGTGWSLHGVSTAGSGDQTQPAIALTNYDGALDRVFSGTIGVSWYEPLGSGDFVTRYAREFYTGRSHALGATTVPTQISSSVNGGPPFFQTIDHSVPVDSANRGVLEYQGITHLPGFSRGGWFGVWSQPVDGKATPNSTTDFDNYWTRWP